MTTCMTEAKGLAANLWDEDMNFAAHIWKILPHSSVTVNTPLESYFGHKPDVSNFKVFGSTAWAQIPHDKRKALQPQSIEFLFIGYPKESKGFIISNIITKQIFIERSVWFEEPLKEIELVEENYAEIPSCSVDNLGE